MKFRIFIAPANSHPNRKGRFQKTSAGRPAAAAFPTPKLSELAYPIDPHRYTRAAPAARGNPAGNWVRKCVGRVRQPVGKLRQPVG